MPCTRSQSTNEPSPDGPLLTDDTATGDHVSPRSQQLAATQAAAQAAYDADKRYDEETLAAVVVVYDTGREKSSVGIYKMLCR
jgi:hypothetical protein